MLKSILIALDGSESSAQAVQLGVEWAQQCDALLVGLAIVDEEELCRAEPIPLGAAAYQRERDAQRIHHAHREVEQYLGRFALRCADARIACKLLEDVGRPAAQIEREAERYDLVMLGNQLKIECEDNHNQSSALQELLKHSPRPVVVVPERPGQGKHVLVAYDGSTQAARALQAFVAVELPASGDIHVVSIGSDRVEAARRGDRAVEYLRSHNRAAHLRAIKSAEPPAGILMQQAAELDAGLIVMGAFGQPMIRELALGSVTRALLRPCNVPMFLFH